MKVNVRNCCFAIALTMSAASIEGPHLGLVFDASHKALRPILGIPGAAILGQPLDLGVELHKTAVSPRQDFALATEGEHNRVVVLIIGRKAVTPVLGVERKKLNNLGSESSAVNFSGVAPRTVSSAPPLPKAITGVPHACASSGSKPKSSSAANIKA